MIIRSNEELNQYIKTQTNQGNIVCLTGISLYGNGLAVSPVAIKFDVIKSSKGEIVTQDFWGYGDKWTLSKHGMDKVAMAVGIIWQDSKVVDYRTDESGRVTYIKHEVRWERPTTTGISQRGVSIGEYNYYEDLARLRYKQDVLDRTGKVVAKKGEPITEQVEKRRNYAGALAETNAKVRALNEALAELPKTFTQEEITKTLIVFRPVVDVGTITSQTPELLQVYNAKILGIADMIYQPLQNNNILVDNRKIDVAFDKPSEPDKLPQDTIRENKTDDNSNNNLDDEIEQLIKITNYKGKGLNVWRDFDVETKKEFHKFLKEQETKQQQ